MQVFDLWHRLSQTFLVITVLKIFKWERVVKRKKEKMGHRKWKRVIEKKGDATNTVVCPFNPAPCSFCQSFKKVIQQAKGKSHLKQPAHHDAMTFYFLPPGNRKKKNGRKRSGANDGNNEHIDCKFKGSRR